MAVPQLRVAAALLLLASCQPGEAAGPLNVGIVGAGPAGLSLALALRKLMGADVGVRVFDRFDQMKPQLGGGVQLNSGAAVLGRLGLQKQLLAAGRPARRVLSRNVDRDVLLDFDIQKALREDSRSREAGLIDEDGSVLALTIMRDKLQEILAAELPSGTLQLDKTLKDVQLKPRSAGEPRCMCTFEDGEEAEFDLLVGADGIKSVVRDKVVQGDDEPGYTKIRILWGVAPAGSRPAGTDEELHQWFGHGAYCLSASYGGIDGKTYDQCVLVYGDDEGLPEINENWDAAEARKELVARCESSGMPAEVLGVASACERMFEIGSYFRNPLVAWSGLDGHVALLGDAAHAMPPFLGQGANQAVQDAYCLAKELKAFRSRRHASLADALQAYELTRKFPCARLTLNSRILGFVETGLPELGRDAFFRTVTALGITRFIFLDGAMPKV